MQFLFFLPKVGLYYVVIMYRIVKTSTLQNSSPSIIFGPVQPSPSIEVVVVVVVLLLRF